MENFIIPIILIIMIIAMFKRPLLGLFENKCCEEDKCKTKCPPKKKKIKLTKAQAPAQASLETRFTQQEIREAETPAENLFSEIIRQTCTVLDNSRCSFETDPIIDPATRALLVEKIKKAGFLAEENGLRIKITD
jgi:hypothetical protein